MISSFQDRRTAASPPQLPPTRASNRESRPSLPRAWGGPNPLQATFQFAAAAWKADTQEALEEPVAHRGSLTKLESRLAGLRFDSVGNQLIAEARSRGSVRPAATPLGRRLRLSALSWLALLGVLAFAPEVEAQSRKTQEILLISAAVADLATTEYLLHQNATFYESNPLMANRGVRIAGKAAATFVILTLARKLENDGHEKAAKIARLATVAGWAGAAGWNVSLTIRY